MASRKPLVINNGQIQQIQSGDYLPNTVFDPAGNLGGVSGLATNGITVHNGTSFSTVTLTAPASGMTITNADGIGGSPTFAFTGEIASLLGLSNGIVARTASGTLTARTIAGTSNQISVADGDGVAGNPTISIAANASLPGTGAVTIPTGTTGERPGVPTNGMIRYNTTDNQFEFREGGTWVSYGTSDASGTVTSVDAALPTSVFSASSGAVTTSGTLTFTFVDQSANTVFAAPNGSSGTPSFRSLVSDDIPSLDWSKITTGTPTTLAGYGITDAVPNTRQVIAGSGLSGGGALSADVTITLPDTGTAVTDQFVKITTDAKGRVTSTSAVNSSDVTTALGYTPVNKAGDTMSGNLVISSGSHITVPNLPVNATDAVNKAYVDSLVTSGTVWVDPIRNPDFVGVETAVPASPLASGMYIAWGGSYPQTWGTITDVVQGDVMHYTFGAWQRSDTLSAGDRFLCGVFTNAVDSTFPVGLYLNDLVQYVSGDPNLAASWNFPHGRSGAHPGWTANAVAATDTITIAGTDATPSIKVGNTVVLNGTPYTVATVSFSTDTTITTVEDIPGNLTGVTLFAEFGDGITVLTSNTNDSHHGQTYLYSNSTNDWYQISGPGAVDAGIGLAYTGTTLNVNLGAGIAQLPSDEVGIDLYDAVSDAIILTEDGTTRSTGTAAQLALLLDGSTLSKSATGLKVADNGITATQLNSSVAGAGLAGGGGTALSVNVDDSTLEINVDTVRVKDAGITAAKLAAAVAGNGLTNSGTALDVNVDNSTIELNADALRVKDGGITNAKLVNSSTTFAGTSGTPTSVSLGGTLTIAAGTGVTTTASANTVTIALSANVDDLDDVVITSAANKDVLYYDSGTGEWKNAQPGSTSGVQPYDDTLSALASLTSTPGIIAETGADTFTTRVIAGTSGRVTVTNGDGISGNPTVDLDVSGVTAGTYSRVTVDTYGRVTAGSVESGLLVSMTNANAGSLVIGTPVYVSTADNVDKADADLSSAIKVVGLVADSSISAAAAGNIAVAGIVTATTGQWDAVTGQTGGLTAGATYYVSATAGMLTTTAPSGDGQFIAPVGLALSTTMMKVDIKPTIQL